jgi:hypothetical protein
MITKMSKSFGEPVLGALLLSLPLIACSTQSPTGPTGPASGTGVQGSAISSGASATLGSHPGIVAGSSEWAITNFYVDPEVFTEGQPFDAVLATTCAAVRLRMKGEAEPCAWGVVTGRYTIQPGHACYPTQADQYTLEAICLPENSGVIRDASFLMMPVPQPTPFPTPVPTPTPPPPTPTPTPHCVRDCFAHR